jgi:protocatechuate 3,4-dioxygenase beta subunit
MHRLVVVVLVAATLGCAMRVRGSVTDAHNGRPIPNAYVSSDCYPSAVATDSTGRYELKTRWSSCTLTVFAPGYRTRIVSMHSPDENQQRQDIVLWRMNQIDGRVPPRSSKR